ncbi:hypothetical protein B0H67DRAFT_645620 [Lasiosphaeris hirsuta]|uniref:Uncharacterized protein n=1 Tax=Lasiosphaeris hirsuta TaxID=260670 RepID=A0AA40AHH8_9PEZI|nr:hypothetical protein B0H67DRAFT_645620 [Lasiosphaeris hirsuta]
MAALPNDITMAERNPLVAGGTYKGYSSHPMTFLTHTLPAIHENAIIVAATHPTVQTGNQTKDGWFLSDLYAFNYLLNGSVADQTWLTAANPERLVEKYGDFLHGSPDEDHKVVLSRDLLKSDITPVTLVKSAKMIDKFLSEVNKASLRAKNSGCPLLLMVFCHGIDGHYLCLDNGTRHKGISIVQLKAALDPGVSVILFTTAYYSGGWAVTPELNNTTMAAMKHDDHSVSWRLSSSMGRACGSVFAGATISALSDASTPLLGQDSSSEVLAIGEAYIQPQEPTEASGITDDDTANHTYLTGGTDSFAIVDEMTLAVVHSRVTSMAKLFFEKLCPGDWDEGPNVAVGGAIFRFLHNDPNDPDTPSASEIADIICFRWDTCLLVDRFVDDHGLNRPEGKICVV